MSETYDVCIVGAGFTGVTCAERFTCLGKKVIVLDSRPYVGGTSADKINALGNLVSLYGPHAFHTNSRRVWEYIKQFSLWKPYEQRSKTRYNGELYDIPINANTIEQFFGLTMDSEEQCAEFMRHKIMRKSSVSNSFDLAMATMGDELYNAFFKGYTEKQWNMPANKLSRAVIGRLPVRFNRDDRYFTDTYQALPSEGYSRLMKSMLTGSTVVLDCGEVKLKEAKELGKIVIWTGALDQAFDYVYGPLAWRSLRFEEIGVKIPQEASVIHEANPEVPYTRTMDSSYFWPGYQNEDKWITLLREWSADDGEKFYPILTNTQNELLNRYYFRSANTKDVHFLGRLGRYKYINMDQAISDALHFMDNFVKGTHARIHS